MNNSISVFCSNLQTYYKNNGFETYSQMADDIEVSEGTLKCWMSGNRTPKLANLENLANTLGCQTYMLLMPYGDLNNHSIVNSSIHQVFTTQLRIQFLNHQATTMNSQLSLLNDVISYNSLVSYLRKSNYRMPTLSTLDRIADQLGIKSFELIKEDITHD